jgi:hypothetical protein
MIILLTVIIGGCASSADSRAKSLHLKRKAEDSLVVLRNAWYVADAKSRSVDPLESERGIQALAQNEIWQREQIGERKAAEYSLDSVSKIR